MTGNDKAVFRLTGFIRVALRPEWPKQGNTLLHPSNGLKTISGNKERK